MNFMPLSFGFKFYSRQHCSTPAAARAMRAAAFCRWD